MGWALVEWEGLGGPLGRLSGGLEPGARSRPGMEMGVPAERQRSLLVPHRLGNREWEEESEERCVGVWNTMETLARGSVPGFPELAALKDARMWTGGAGR